jgi:hypothetical protein
MMEADRHDALTVAAIACLAFIIADLSHEVLGHGVVAYLLGAHHFLLSSTYLSSDINSKLIDAAGTIANLLEGALAWLVMRRGRGSVHWRYFLWLLVAFNFLDATGYFLFSAVSNSGDWAEIVKGLGGLSEMRFVMGLIGGASYILSTYVCARSLTPFSERLDDLCFVPYWTVLVVNSAAAAFNPLGIKYLLVSAIPATAGANAALIIVPKWTRRLRRNGGLNLLVSRSIPLVAGAALTALIFIFVIGRGISWNR